MKFKLIEGVRKIDDGKFEIDYSLNLPTDIINIYSNHLYTSSFGNNIYWFGYRFNEEISSKTRSEFINYIKGLTTPKITEQELDKFIIYPLKELNKYINQYHIDCFISPRSGRSALVQKMIELIGNYTSRNMERCNFELIKLLPSNVTFDWKSFDNDFTGNEQAYMDIYNYIENLLLPSIHSLDYFSLAKAVKPKYRKYIQNYLDFSSESVKNTFKKLKCRNILIVDDINTSGATLQEILRIINDINTDCNIYIYTLIGKE